VTEGEHVAAGTLLARQEAGTMEPRLAQGRASLAEAEQRLDELVHGPRARELDEAGATLKGRKAGLDTELREFERVRELVSRKLLPDSELDQARARRDVALASRDEARARLRLLEEGTRAEQLAQARAAVERERAALAELEVTAERYAVRAPRAGLVEALPYEVGERPPVGAPLAILLADGAPYARVHIPEPLRTAYVPGSAVVSSRRRHCRGDSRQGALRLRAGVVHALLRAHAAGPQPPRVSRGDHTRRCAGGKAPGGRPGAGAPRRWSLRRASAIPPTRPSRRAA
jgi:HlyD family secretion protein